MTVEGDTFDELTGGDAGAGEEAVLAPDEVVGVQDPVSVYVLQMLEWFGFCGVGEAGPFVADGHTDEGGECPEWACAECGTAFVLGEAGAEAGLPRVRVAA